MNPSHPPETTRPSGLAKLARDILSVIGRAAMWLLNNTVVATVNAARASQDVRKGMLIASAWFVGGFILWFGVPATWNFVADTVTDFEVTTIDRDEPAYVDIVRTSRGQLDRFHRDILPHVVEEYNQYVDSERWRRGAERCMTFLEQFEEVERLTLYPKEFIAGVALHESDGCRQGASDWAGGRGLMQITNIDRTRHVVPVGQMLNIPTSEVDYRRNTLHNLLVGVMVLDDYERRLGSRPHGMLAYNEGVGGVRRDARETGWSPGEELPSVTEMRPNLRYSGGMKPRVYVPRVLATVVMMDRRMNGNELTQLDRIRPGDIPGWNPADDGSDWLTQLGLLIRR